MVKRFLIKPMPDYLDEEHLSYSKQYVENLTGVDHKILNDERAPTFVPNPHDFPRRELVQLQCRRFCL